VYRVRGGGSVVDQAGTFVQSIVPEGPAACVFRSSEGEAFVLCEGPVDPVRCLPFARLRSPVPIEDETLLVSLAGLGGGAARLGVAVGTSGRGGHWLWE
jgi:hypothetical protein